MKVIKTVFFFLFVVVNVTAQQKFYKISKEKLNALLIKKSSENLTVTERMNFFSEMFLGMPYGLTCVGDGPYALYDTKPLLNFEATNCMVFCEDVLALSVSDSYENFFNTLHFIFVSSSFFFHIIIIGRVNFNCISPDAESTPGKVQIITGI